MIEYLYKTENIIVYKDGFNYYYNIGNGPINFIPYIINGEKLDNKRNKIIDINDFINDCSEYINDNVINIITEKHIEDIDKVWEKIKWISTQKFGKEDKENKNKNIDRKIKIPIQYCRSIQELKPDEEVDIINYYQKAIGDNEYIIDIISTKQKNFYVRITDVTNGYNEIDFYKFKNQYCQPTLFDGFFDI